MKLNTKITLIIFLTIFITSLVGSTTSAEITDNNPANIEFNYQGKPEDVVLWLQNGRALICRSSLGTLINIDDNLTDKRIGVRSFFEKLGFQVQWDSLSQAITVFKDQIPLMSNEPNSLETEQQTQNTEEKTPLSAEKITGKMKEAMEEINSYRIIGDGAMMISALQNDLTKESTTFTYRFDAKTSYKPPKVYMTQNIVPVGERNNQNEILSDTVSEMLITENNFYKYNTDFEVWIENCISNLELAKSLNYMLTIDPAQALKTCENLSIEYELLDETEDYYVINIKLGDTASNKLINKYLYEIFSSYQGSMHDDKKENNVSDQKLDKAMKDSNDSIGLNLCYDVLIDKDTFLTVSYDINAKVDLFLGDNTEKMEIIFDNQCSLKVTDYEKNFTYPDTSNAVTVKEFIQKVENYLKKQH